MKNEKTKVAVIIPALNEEDSIGRVLDDLPDGLADLVLVVDGGSVDDTVKRAEHGGATVVKARSLGYGHACLLGLNYLRQAPPGVVVFLDGDYSDFPGEISILLAPILDGGADFVVGSRLRGEMEAGTMPFHAVRGNQLSCWLISALFGFRFTDLGPFRAIRYNRLMELSMKDLNYGWTAEMQIKAVKAGLKIVEIPVSYRKRIGKSKISGSLSGSIKAGIKIIFTIFKNFL